MRWVTSVGLGVIVGGTAVALGEDLSVAVAIIVGAILLVTISALFARTLQANTDTDVSQRETIVSRGQKASTTLIGRWPRVAGDLRPSPQATATGTSEAQI
jgi:hypothetical protein